MKPALFRARHSDVRLADFRYDRTPATVGLSFKPFDGRSSKICRLHVSL